MIRTSLIINTCALDPYVWNTGNPFRGASYRYRAKLLEEKILPSARGMDEVIVVGQYKPGEGYTYLEMAPHWRDRRDALWQRDLGARHSTGGILIFAHDDHALGEGFAHTLADMLAADPSWDILVPKRVHGLTGATLENGESAGYMGGHVCVFRRWIWAEVPFTRVSTEYWDVPLTRLWRDAGAKIVWTDKLTHIDVEARHEEV